MVTDLDSTVG